MKKLGSYNRIALWLVVLALAPFAGAQNIQISNVEELYSAVNDPGNAGATLVLGRGTYMLSAIDVGGVARPNGGRIQLQPNMSLLGVEGDRDAVVINAFNLPASSFPTTANGVATGPNAAVRMGLGHNSIEWLTVRDARNGQANIDTGLQPLDSADTYIRVAHVTSTGSARGMNILNFGPQSSGQTIEADVIDSYFFDNVLGVSEGIRSGNFQGSVASTVSVRMSGNLSWGQKVGLSIENNTATNSTVNVVSAGNRLYSNGVGTVIAGGITQGAARADGNTVNLEAHGDEFLDNTLDTDFDHGGLVVVGSENASTTGGGGDNNMVNIQLWGCRMQNNELWDLAVFGARSYPTNLLMDPSLNQNNHVTIEMKGDGNGNGKWQPVQSFIDSIPSVPDYDNSVTIIQ